MTKPLAALALVVASGACRQAADGPAPVFDAPVRVNDLVAGGQSEPSIAVAGDGRTLMSAWIDWAGAVPQVRLARSTNGGATFGASWPVVAADTAHPHGQAEATLAFVPGRFAFGWIGCRPDAESLEDHACDVYVVTSTSGGATWSAPRPIAEGGHDRRDRPWVIADGGRFAISWSEIGPSGSRWKVAREATPGGEFTLEDSIEGRASMQPLAPGGGDALLIDRTLHDPRRIALELRRSNGRTRWTYAPEAALLPYSLGAFRAREGGEAWVAIPEGTGDNNDLGLYHRESADGAFRRVHSLRSADAKRVGLPWISTLPSGRFLTAWIDEGLEGWRVRARILGPGAAVSAPTDVSRAAFQFHEASRTQNIGDFLATASSGDAFWVAWSDTREGNADVWISRGHLQ